MDSIEDLTHKMDILCQAIRLGGCNLAPDYYNYLRIGFGLAHDMGEAGRSYFHDICCVDGKYNRSQADKQYDACMKRGDAPNPCTLGTVFEIAKQSGVDMDTVNDLIKKDWVERHKNEKWEPKNHKNIVVSRNQSVSTQVVTPESVTVEGEETGSGEEESDKVKVEGSEPPAPLPTFSGRYDFPTPFKEAMAYGSTEAEKDVIFLSVATVLGATLNWTVRTGYGHDYRYPQMQTFVIAEAASGKSIIDYARAFAMPLHKQRRTETEEANRAYKRAMRDWRMAMKRNANGGDEEVGEEPEKPKNKMFLIPANNSASGMIQCLIDSGGNGLIQESEADTLTIIMKSDFGNWSDVMRKTYDHGWISFNRRTDREFMEIQHTRLAVLIAGTPSQLAPLIPSADNGLFSREIFYYMPSNNTWQNQIDVENTTITQDFMQLSDLWEQKRIQILQRGVHQLVFTNDQKQRFNEKMQELLDETMALGYNDLRATVKRLGVTMARLASIVGICRIYGDGRIDLLGNWRRGVHPDNHEQGMVHTNYGISENDFEACLEIIPVLLRHASHVLSFLPSTQVKRTKRFERDEFLARLPLHFNYTDYAKLAEELGVKKNTAKSWIGRFVKAGIIIHDAEKQMYEKKEAATSATLQPD